MSADTVATALRVRPLNHRGLLPRPHRGPPARHRNLATALTSRKNTAATLAASIIASSTLPAAAAIDRCRISCDLPPDSKSKPSGASCAILRPACPSVCRLFPAGLLPAPDCGRWPFRALRLSVRLPPASDRGNGLWPPLYHGRRPVFPVRLPDRANRLWTSSSTDLGQHLHLRLHRSPRPQHWFAQPSCCALPSASLSASSIRSCTRYGRLIYYHLF